MNKIKVLRIIARLNIGGPAIHTVLLTEGLNNQDFSSLLVCGKVGPEEGDMSYYAAENGVCPEVIPELGPKISPWKDLLCLIKLCRLIKRENPQIIHTHTAKAGALGRLAGILTNLGRAKDKRIKLVHTFHGHVLSGYFGKWQAFIFTHIERLLARFSDQIITVSESVKENLLKLKIAPGKKIRVIRLGFQLEKFLAVPEKTENGFFNVGIVGRLAPVKNHRLFLDAAAILAKTPIGKKINFQVAGDGQLRQDLEKYSSGLGLGHCLTFLGWQKDLEKVYAGLDLLVLTSINEGTPVSIIEAMASSRAVIASEVGGIKDLLGKELADIAPLKGIKLRERGISLENADAAALAGGIELILSDRAMRLKLSSHNRAFAKENFSRERLLADTAGLYRELLELKI